MKMMKKALCVGAVATAAALGTVGTAVAAPAPASQAHTVTAVTSHAAVKATGKFASPAGAVVPNVNPVVFSCSYVSLVPFQKFQFTCTVQSGRLQLFLVCSNGARVYSPIMPAINTYYPILSCPAGTQVSTINWQAV